MLLFDFLIALINPAKSLAISPIIEHWWMMTLIEISAQNFCIILIFNSSNISLPVIGLKPSETEYVFHVLLSNCWKNGGFSVPKFSTVSFENNFSSSGFFLNSLMISQLYIKCLAKERLFMEHPLPEWIIKIQFLFPIVIFMICGVISFILELSNRAT